jgi:sulfite dehydrogenase (cytochrome) subunit B
MRRRRITGRVAAAVAVALATAALADGEGRVQLKDGPGKDLTSSRCVICHTLEYIPSNAPAMDRAAWQKTVQKMRERFGAPISDEEAQSILDYLSATYADKS